MGYFLAVGLVLYVIGWFLFRIDRDPVREYIHGPNTITTIGGLSCLTGVASLVTGAVLFLINL